MLKTTREIQSRLSQVDIVVEVRDARIPFSSCNDILEKEIKNRQKQKLIIFNKADLAHSNTPQIVAKHLPNTPHIFTSATDGFNIKNIISTCLKKFTIVRYIQFHKFIFLRKFKTIPAVFLIAGIPNVGKSSIINSLRNKYANTFETQKTGRNAKVGALPGVTRTINFFKVCEKPFPCVVLDSPGVFLPTIHTEDQAFKLALINALPDTLAFDQTYLCDYVLYQLNRTQSFEYVSVYQLLAPSDDITVVLTGVAKHLVMMGPEGRYDLGKAAVTFLRHYRSGKLGRVTLEDSPLEIIDSQ
jgi:ribosome biogenesis GTPase A